MALTRRAALVLLAGTAGCTALTNDVVEMAIENRSGGEQHVTATATPVTGGDESPAPEATAAPDFEGTVPPGSRQLVPDVAPSPASGEGAVPVRVEIVTGTYEATERIDVTGPGTIDVRITRNGIRMFFAAQD